MPVIVIGADTPTGASIVDTLMHSASEVRAFISDPTASDGLRAKGAKVAIGDVSDASHVEAAAMRCFCAVVVAEAASDVRERAFATNPESVQRGWLAALEGSKLTRVIWIDDPQHPVDRPTLDASAPEAIALESSAGVADQVAALENADSLA